MLKKFTSINSFDIFSNRVQNVLDFLSKLFSDGHSYSLLNTASSALSSIISINKVPCGKNPDVKRFMKGIFELLQTFPKYHMIWDVKKVFNYFRNLPIISDFTLKEFSLKLAMLFCLVSGGQRIQTMHLINWKILSMSEIKCLFQSKIKQIKPGNQIYPLSFKTYPKDTKQCVVAHLKRYIELTLRSWNNSRLPAKTNWRDRLAG